MNTFLNTANSELLSKLDKFGHKKNVPEGYEIFSEGAKAEFLPIIISGKIKMVRFPEVGKEVIIGVFQDGEMFAVPPVFDGKNYPSTAIAMEDTKLLILYRKDFLQLLKESSDFSFQVISWMCERLREKTAAINNLATASPEHRIGNVLIQLAQKESSKLPIKISLRRQDIAEIAGLTTETTIRAIRKLADKKLIKIVHGKIILEDLKSLCDYFE